MSNAIPSIEPPLRAAAPIARRWLAGHLLDAQIRQDIAEIYAERGFVLATDLIQIGYSRAQVYAFRTARP